MGSLLIHFPEWLGRHEAAFAPSLDIAARMRHVIGAAALNVAEQTGGPFAAGVFRCDTGELVALGVNLVTNQGLSALHAEMVAITRAQRLLGSYDLGGPGMPAVELVSSAEPCAMCFGAIPWSGVRRVVCGAVSADAEAIGFDEGPRHPDWRAQLELRGIAVETEVCRAEAKAVFTAYAAAGGEIYNSRRAAG